MGHKQNLDPGGVRCADCGKMRYLSRRLARGEAQRLRGRGYGKMFPYRACQGFWHLTSQERVKAAWYRERAS
jgi:hypothetical protein